MQIVRQRRKPVRVDMSPLIDCIFQLLIFFMLSSTFLTPKIQLNLPSASEKASSQAEDFVMVTIQKEGVVFANQEEVGTVSADQDDPAWERLEGKLKELLAKSKKKVVTLRCDKESPHGLFVKALDIAKSCGAVHVNVAHVVEE